MTFLSCKLVFILLMFLICDTLLLGLYITHQLTILSALISFVLVVMATLLTLNEVQRKEKE